MGGGGGVSFQLGRRSPLLQGPCNKEQSYNGGLNKTGGAYPFTYAGIMLRVIYLSNTCGVGTGAAARSGRSACGNLQEPAVHPFIPLDWRWVLTIISLLTKGVSTRRQFPSRFFDSRQVYWSVSCRKQHGLHHECPCTTNPSQSHMLSAAYPVCR